MVYIESSHPLLAEELAIAWLKERPTITNFWVVQACAKYHLPEDDETVARLKQAAKA